MERTSKSSIQKKKTKQNKKTTCSDSFLEQEGADVGLSFFTRTKWFWVVGRQCCSGTYVTPLPFPSFSPFPPLKNRANQKNQYAKGSFFPYQKKNNVIIQQSNTKNLKGWGSPVDDEPTTTERTYDFLWKKKEGKGGEGGGGGGGGGGGKGGGSCFVFSLVFLRVYEVWSG